MIEAKEGRTVTLLEQYQKLNLDGSLFGLETGAEEGGYFCTPIGMRVIGWEGVGGIHYGTIDSMGETIFAVDPENFGDQLVFPIARNFGDLLRLLLSCGSMAAIEQCQRWDWESFQQFLREDVESPDRREALARIERELDLRPMEDPFSYIKELQATFDENTISYSNEYYDTLGLPRPDGTEPEEQGFALAEVEATLET